MSSVPASRQRLTRILPRALGPYGIVIGQLYLVSNDGSFGREDWLLEGVWAIGNAHGAWSSHSGAWHLDGNPTEVDLAGLDQGQRATLEGWVTIPGDAVQPSLSFWRKLELLAGDTVSVRVQVEGSDVWTLLRAFTAIHNDPEYARTDLSLAEYAGIAVRIQFEQASGAASGPRLLVIDDVRTPREASVC
jgi:hypothetical protein